MLKLYRTTHDTIRIKARSLEQAQVIAAVFKLELKEG